jgi:hypothetical protein
MKTHATYQGGGLEYSNGLMHMHTENLKTILRCGIGKKFMRLRLPAPVSPKQIKLLKMT